MAAAERSGNLPAMLANGPVLPDACHEAWAAFLALHQRRGSTGFGAARIGFGAARIGYGDIDAYQRVTHDVLLPWEVTAIHRADDAYFAAQPKAKGK